MKVTFFSVAEWSTCCCCVAFGATRAVQTDTVTASSDVWYMLDNSFNLPLQCGLLLVWAACSLQRRLPHHIAPWWVGLCWHGNDEESCGPCNTHVAQTSPGVCTSLFRVHVCVCVCVERIILAELFRWPFHVFLGFLNREAASLH